MAEYDLYVDCDQGLTVTSETDSTPKVLPQFVQGNTPKFRVHLLKNFNRASDYEQIPCDGLTLQVALWTTADGILASQYSWAATEDDLAFEAEFAMNTSEIDAFLGSASVKQALFQIDYLRSGLPTTVLQKTVRVLKTGIDLDSLVPVATPTPLSAEAAAGMFVAIIETRPIYLQGANGTKVKLWNDDSGGSAQFKAENVS